MNTHNKNFETLDIPIIAKLFVVYEKTHKLIFTLPKFERYSLGEKLETTVLEIYDLIICANHASKYDKTNLLIRANAKIEIVKLLFRVCLECDMIETKVYLDIEHRLQEIGKMTQGWIRYSRNNA